jgi:hypothetical protein
VVSDYGTTYPPPNVQSITFAEVVWVGVTIGIADDSTTPGQALFLTATTNLDVGPTPYFIEIFDLNVGAAIAICGSGTTCETSVTQTVSTIRNYIASVSQLSTTYPPATTLATSNTALRTWLAVGLVGDPTTLPAGQATTLTATAGLDVGPTPYYIEIFDLSDGGGTVVAICGSGTTCTAQWSWPSPAGHAFTAYISRFSPSFPLNDFRAFSNGVSVFWR